jgi:putative membrane protein
MLATLFFAAPAQSPAQQLRRPEVSAGQVSRQIERLPAQDRKFVQHTAGALAAQIQLAELAAQRGSTAKLRRFGEDTVATARAFRDELRRSLRKQGVELPHANPTPEQERRIRGVSERSGPEFDRAYREAFTALQDETYGLLLDQVSRGKVPALVEIAERMLPGFRRRIESSRRELEVM